MPRVYNKHHGDAPADAVYVGRPTKWGNPYSHLPGTMGLSKVATREEAIRLFEEGITKELREAIIQELRGKDLVCWCAPKACHADVLLRLANA